jgi:hypothetical protein
MNFEEVFRSMTPVSKMKTMETDYQDPLYKSLQVHYRSGRSADLDGGETGRMGIKLSPLAWGQRGQESELNSEYKKLSKTVNLEGAGRECLFRSSMMASASHIFRTLKAYEKLDRYYEDQNRILKRGIGENLFEFKELLSVREKQVENKLRILESRRLLESVEAVLNQRLDKPVKLSELEFKNFLTVEAIKSRASALEPKKIELMKLQSLSKIENLEFEIEKKESDKIFDSVELYRWSARRNDDVAHGIQFTFNIPFLHKRTYLKDSLQRQLAINKLSEAQRELTLEMKGTQNDFLNKIERYETLRDSDYYKTLKSLKKLLSASRNNSPLMIIQTKVKMASERLKQEDLKNEIVMDYLEKLFLSGSLESCESPSFLVRN